MPIQELPSHELLSSYDRLDVGHVPGIDPWTWWRIEAVDTYLDRARISDVPELRLPDGMTERDPDLMAHYDGSVYQSVVDEITARVRETGSQFDLALLDYRPAVENIIRFQDATFGEAQTLMPPRFYPHHQGLQQVMTADRFISLLGDDVDAREHNLHATKLLYQALQIDNPNIGQTGQGLLLLNEVTHDTAEVIAGDLRDGRKHGLHDFTEALVGRYIRRHILGNHFYLDPDAAERILHTIQVINYKTEYPDSESLLLPEEDVLELRRYRRSIEVCGYFATGIDMVDLVGSEDVAAKESDALQACGTDVLAGQGARLMTYSDFANKLFDLMGDVYGR